MMPEFKTKFIVVPRPKHWGDVCLNVIKLIAFMSGFGVYEPIYITQPHIVTNTKHIHGQKHLFNISNYTNQLNIKNGLDAYIIHN